MLHKGTIGMPYDILRHAFSHDLTCYLCKGICALSGLHEPYSLLCLAPATLPLHLQQVTYKGRSLTTTLTLTPPQITGHSMRTHQAIASLLRSESVQVIYCCIRTPRKPGDTSMVHDYTHDAGRTVPHSRTLGWTGPCTIRVADVHQSCNDKAGGCCCGCAQRACSATIRFKIPFHVTTRGEKA
ncbi:uncharacterized protein M421DRAFT_352849 [Didymella exigua CBS 183.55]|uniref:Uncharacterized protein n=1 Tax=Didymella exigua CBS 183.55 TaxID=1150837 RepID=A0A6A5R4H9_9PLEO|nr:uncharacterized protein M421DRAFT_352849 [Didymella exigua CBS 183.55]KAF1922592.1 hypothetical protein M421DRAFT_352849 [Didymella exigua CBS 183.55]